jgi:hypothetical protein
MQAQVNKHGLCKAYYEKLHYSLLNFIKNNFVPSVLKLPLPFQYKVPQFTCANNNNSFS